MIRLRSNYCLKKSLIEIDKYILWLKKNDLKVGILVDTNINGFMHFYNLCLENNIKPIIGFEKEQEYIIFPTSTKSLSNFFNHINNNSLNFENLIVYDISSSLNFDNCFYKTKNFDHEIYNGLQNFLFWKEILDTNLKIITKENYIVDKNLIEATNYEINKDFNMYTFESDYKKLISILASKIKQKNLVLNEVETKRLNFELKVIREKNFCSYFLIFVDIISYLKKNQILYGFGRGSSPSSFICYLLDISKINPLINNLYFERFLNMERMDFPDIDLDIDASKQEEIMNYLMKKYPNSGKIITFVTLGVKKAQDIVNKKYKFPELILKKLRSGSKNEIENLIKTDNNITNFSNDVEQISNQIVDINVHPAGIIIANTNLSSKVPILNNIIGWEYKWLEKLGYVKLDLLKLTTLTHIKKVNDLIKKNYVNMQKFSINDEKIFKLVNNLETKYVFQISSNLARNILKNFKITCFSDLAILISLNRPGTKDLIEQIKQNQKNNKNSNKTYNVLIYQEQIMSLLVAKYKLNPSQANNIRIAISKKDNNYLNKVEEYIKSKNYDLKWLNYAKKYTKFAFNKAHAYSYARLVMQILYYKTYYPLEFMLTFTEDNLSIDDFAYLKYRKQELREFNLQTNSKIMKNKLHLGLKYLKIDSTIKNFMISKQTSNLVTIRNQFENKISNNDIKKLVLSNIFKNKIQTSDKFEIENNNMSSLMRVRSWEKLENKLNYTYTTNEFNFLQLQVLGFSFTQVFENLNTIYIEDVEFRNNMMFGVLLCNYGRINFIAFEKLNLELNHLYICNFYASFFNLEMNIVIKNIIKHM